MIKEQVKSITNTNGSTNNTAVWNLRRKIFPKPAQHMSGKKDKDGNLITNPEKLKELYIEAYMERLTHREMSPGLLKLRTLRERLFAERL